MQRYKKAVVNTRNRMLSQNVSMSIDTRLHNLNDNILIIGGSGCGKTFRFAKPNIMQMTGSYVITDPKGEIARDCAAFLKKYGYRVVVLDLIEYQKSSRYNPFIYIQSQTDIEKLVKNIMTCTTPKGASSSDPFWEKAESMFLNALFLYVWTEGVLNPETGKKERNMGAVMRLLTMAECDEDPRTGQRRKNELDRLMEELAARNKEAGERENPAIEKYNKAMKGAVDTVRSIIISANARLSPLESPEILDLLSEDEMHLTEIGTEKTVVFCKIPDVDKTYNFIVGMLYTQLFQQLYYAADFIYGGSLPLHVTFLLDEFANVALPDDYCSLLSTMRSRNISSIIIIQNQSQIKALFEKTYETIIGNCDTMVFLGSNEQSTQKMVSEAMGKITLYKKSHGLTRGKNGSSSENEDVLGRDLMMQDEVRKMGRDHCIILINGIDPIKDEKVRTWEHPMWHELNETAKIYQFDARRERIRKKTTSTSEENIEFVPASTVNHYNAMDKKDLEEWKIKCEIARAEGKDLPPKPRLRVINITLEQLENEIDLSNVTDDDIQSIDWNEIISEEEMQQNMEERMEQIEEEEREYHENNIDIKKEIHGADQTKLFLLLRKDGFDAQQIRSILRLCEKYDNDEIISYFSPDMDLEEIDQCIEIMMEAS